MWLGDTTIFVRAGFAVRVNGNHHPRRESWDYDPCCLLFAWHDWYTAAIITD